jgi:hypothetical protein
MSRRLVAFRVFLALICALAAVGGCRSPHPSADEATELWADASNRENQLKQLVIRYQEAGKRIDDYQFELDKVEDKLRVRKEALAAKREELATANAEYEAAKKELDLAQTGAAAAKQHAAESRRQAEDAAAESADADRRKTEITARLTEKKHELDALEKAEAELKKKLAAAVDRAVVLREAVSGTETPKIVRLTLNSVRRDGVVSVVAKGSDKLQIGDQAEVRRAGELVGKLTLVETMISAGPDSDAPVIYAARFEPEKEGVTPSLSDEITAVPPER